MSDPADGFALQRFVNAQTPVWPDVVTELGAGRKRSHWMWFVFPQLRALGRSETALFYGIGSLAEARAYLAHPLLGQRLAEATELALAAEAPSLHALFGSPDDMKFRSSMTLFAVADGNPESRFHAALARWCGGVVDPLTLAALRG
ncbi:DUF1810 domain-containing protein [Mesorhizobium sp. BR1-1-16]|uniref:DUF1810 domain-containing protein n=1 Tax=Mesorhizobium sp. BR1-1-16 TaxID=2876653 RepID=UPI001CD01F10|nr:DUF1810 domain-containing protein [Mesorhizobium sp. BR1-1-16]MBZ9937968.1 DUF1810 domain-containing protein [Mesorhizobium sp. BR1-1-16]